MPGSSRPSRPAPAHASANGSGSGRAAARTATSVPTDWRGEFGGPAWTRTTNPDGTPGEWYLHLFTPEQPDLNWDHPDVRREHEDILRFWFDRGAAGVRIDSAALLLKDPALPEITGDHAPGDHPTTDRDELHDIYRSWRAIADSYPGARILVGELWIGDPERFARYLRPDELHTAFNFDFMARPWEARALRASIDGTLASHRPIGAPATWTLSNHDVTRPVTRYGRGGQLLRVRAEALRDAHRSRARSPARPRRGAAHRGPAGLPVPLPGRRARPRRGRDPSR